MENLDQGNNKNVSLSLIAEYGTSDSDSESIKYDDSTFNDEDDSTELSEMVLKNNIINACAHGPLSRTRNDEEATRQMIIDSPEGGVVEYEVSEYRNADSDSDSTSAIDSNSDVDSVKDVEEISSGDECEGVKSSKQEPPKVQGELGLDDLPPIEDLAISLPAEDMAKIGVIASVVDRLVIVRAFPNTPAVDLESVLFLENGGKALGKVFDVFGPVSEPHYCVRFNSQEHVRERGVTPGLEVFYAPKNKEHTSYVFLSELMKIKGSDASWLNDIEPPPQHIDYSDDDDERQATRRRKEANKQKHDGTDSGETSKNPGRKDSRKNQRPSESSSRFTVTTSRARNPFSMSHKRQPQMNVRPNLYRRPYPQEMGVPLTAPPGYPIPTPIFPPPFNPSTPPPFIGNPSFQFGGHSNLNPMPRMLRHGMPVFNPNFCNMSGPQHNMWLNNGPPPPPGT